MTATDDVRGLFWRIGLKQVGVREGLFLQMILRVQGPVARWQSLPANRQLELAALMVATVTVGLISVMV